MLLAGQHVSAQALPPDTLDAQQRHEVKFSVLNPARITSGVLIDRTPITSGHLADCGLAEVALPDAVSDICGFSTPIRSDFVVLEEISSPAVGKIINLF